MLFPGAAGLFAKQAVLQLNKVPLWLKHWVEYWTSPSNTDESE